MWRKVAKSHSLSVPQIIKVYQTFVGIVCSSLEMYIGMQPLLPPAFSLQLRFNCVSYSVSANKPPSPAS